MSVRIMSRVWESSPYRGNHLLVLLALADWANDEGWCWPLAQTLADKARISRATCFRVLDDLERDGVLVREQRRNHSTLYRLLPPRSGSQFATPSQPEPPGSQDETSSGLTGETQNRQGTTTRTTTLPPDGGDVSGDAQGSLLPMPQASTSAVRRKPDPLWDAVMFVCAVDTDSIPRAARGRYNAAVRDLREVGAEPAEVLRRAAIFRTNWPTIRLTPNALSARWAECGEFVANEPAKNLRRKAEDEHLAARMRALDEEDERRSAG